MSWMSCLRLDRTLGNGYPVVLNQRIILVWLLIRSLKKIIGSISWDQMYFLEDDVDEKQLRSSAENDEEKSVFLSSTSRTNLANLILFISFLLLFL